MLFRFCCRYSRGVVSAPRFCGRFRSRPTVRFIGQFSADRGGSAGSPSRDAGQLAPVPLFSTRAEAKEVNHQNPLKKIIAKSWCGAAAALIRATNHSQYQKIIAKSRI